MLIHGSDNANDVPRDKLIVFPRTEGVSSGTMRSRSVTTIVNIKNRKAIFSAGPSSLLAENLLGLEPCFGRGDSHYEQIENRVLSLLRHLSGHGHIVRLQGSATLALEIAIRNFVAGRVLVITTGYYGDRLVGICKHARQAGSITDLEIVKLADSCDISGHYDWIVTVSLSASPLRMSTRCWRIGIVGLELGNGGRDGATLGFLLRALAIEGRELGRPFRSLTDQELAPHCHKLG